jgi:cation diffusion facilitator CzcD-associated flavoprotein CzcO
MSPNRPKTRIAIVGGGISGIAQGIRIKEAVGDRVELTVSDLAGVWTEVSADRVNFGFSRLDNRKSRVAWWDMEGLEMAWSG